MERSSDPYQSQPPISNTISPVNPASPVNHVSPLNHVSPIDHASSVNAINPVTETGTETVIKADNARVKRAKQRIRQQIYVGKIVS